ncbi:hypothetical protein [Alkalihalobacillus sp. R86527]|uniref:hypothetical protein n=1 Tax=Alkalihalobacillus sp. R86527 TaxID=3093863 RepID=UPI00366FEF12
MHDKQEIEILCDALRTYWRQHPEKKLGQLLSDLYDEHSKDKSFHDTGDDEWLHWMLENSKHQHRIEKKYRYEAQISDLEKHIRPELIEVIRRFSK